MRRHHERAIPLKRMAEPNETMGPRCPGLAGSKYITGTQMVIDGGNTPGTADYSKGSTCRNANR